MTTGASVADRSILARLKDETRPEHVAIEGSLDLMGDALTLAAYRRRLEQFHGYYSAVEGRLLGLADWDKHGIDLDARRKTPLLETDLRALGLETVAGLPICPDVPDLTDMADGFGCLYVLEGSTLGGRFISRHVGTLLGVTHESGGRFFHAYGERTGAMWRDFGAALEAFATGRESQDRVVVAAIATFGSLRRWFRREQAT